MGVLNVALLQMTAHWQDMDANRAKGEDYCRLAARRGADIALFPEMWSHGYSFPDREDAGAVERWMAGALGHDSDYVLQFRALARELEMAIAVTYLEAWPGGPRNSVTVVDRRGEEVLTHAKVHTCDWGAEHLLTRGDDFPVGELDTAAGTVKVGCMICYDREFPETARVLMLRGAEMILTPNACGLEVNRLSQFRARSFENAMAMAMTNYAAPRCNGHSVAFDGMAHDKEGKDRDILVLEAGDEEGVFMAPFDLDALKAYRERTLWGDAHRHPSQYADLVNLEVTPPFHREDARR